MQVTTRDEIIREYRHTGNGNNNSEKCDDFQGRTLTMAVCTLGGSPQQLCLHSDLQGRLTTPPTVRTPSPAERGPGTTSEGRQTVITCTHSTCTLHALVYVSCKSWYMTILCTQFFCNSISLHHEPVILSCKVTCHYSDHPTTCADCTCTYK